VRPRWEFSPHPPPSSRLHAWGRGSLGFPLLGVPRFSPFSFFFLATYCGVLQNFACSSKVAGGFLRSGFGFRLLLDAILLIPFPYYYFPQFFFTDLDLTEVASAVC